ncbi:hypothetical protein D7Y23_03420 [Corallococcus sp. AB050B]|nr:hypothetical protein D7Y23_03420 [Corallococcus sp. AB050B]
MTSEFLRVAEKALRHTKSPMTAKQITEWGFEQKIFSDKISGVTPHLTMQAKLSVEIRKRKGASVFVRTAPGLYQLRDSLDPKEIYHAKPFTPEKPKERVLVFDTEHLEKLGRFQGITRKHKQYKKLLNLETCKYIDRWRAEEDEAHKQVLTYILVTRRGHVLCFKRGSYNRAAEFLRGALCIGFGGHLAESDLGLLNRDDLGLSDSGARELSEELRLPPTDLKRLQTGSSLQLIGVLNDDSSPVGRRHFAFVFQYEVSDDPYWDAPIRGEKSITQLKWISPNNLNTPMRHFEYWSQLCLRQYFPNLVTQQPSFHIQRRSPFRPPHFLIALGTIGSGKSEATRVLREQFNYVEVNSGQALARLINLPPVPLTQREDFQQAAWRFIKSAAGPTKLAAALYEEAAQKGTDRILIDGIRQKKTLDAFRRIASPARICTLFVHTPPDLAFSFYRARSKSEINVVDFFKLREASVEQEVAGLIVESDAVLYNWTDREKYRQTVIQLISEATNERWL